LGIPRAEIGRQPASSLTDDLQSIESGSLQDAITTECGPPPLAYRFDIGDGLQNIVEQIDGFSDGSRSVLNNCL